MPTSGKAKAAAVARVETGDEQKSSGQTPKFRAPIQQQSVEAFRSGMVNLVDAGDKEVEVTGVGSATTVLTKSASFKTEGVKRASGRRRSVRRSMEADEFINLFHGSDPVKVELNRLENEVREKERELGEVQWEIKALKLSDRAREKAVEELSEELNKLDGKLKLRESLLERKNLDIQKISDEKKAAMAAQFAAEATLRRVHAAQNDDNMPPVEAILAPLEAELKLSRQEVAKLQDDNRALDRLTKSKEAALLETEGTIQVALAKASLVDDLQVRNRELRKRIEVCQEENKILDKLNRQKVTEVEKISQTVRQLEEAILAGGVAANTVRDYQRKFQEMNEEKKTLDRELARTKGTANRVAIVVANEWKDSNDKVMPVKQWLAERKFMQGEMQQLRDKLALVERSARFEALSKEKSQFDLKVLEEGLRTSTNSSSRIIIEGSLSNGSSRRQSLGGADNTSKSSPHFFLSTKSPSFQLRSSLSTSTSTVLKYAKGTSRSFDGGTRSLDRGKIHPNGTDVSLNRSTDTIVDIDANKLWKDNPNDNLSEFVNADLNDTVSGVLYDTLQKEVIILRKTCHERDRSLKDKDDAIELLAKKVDTLTKAMEVEAKKMKREVAAMEKEVTAMLVDKEQDNRGKRLGSSRGPVSISKLLSGRNVPGTAVRQNLQ